MPQVARARHTSCKALQVHTSHGHSVKKLGWGPAERCAKPYVYWVLAAVAGGNRGETQMLGITLAPHFVRLLYQGDSTEKIEIVFYGFYGIASDIPNPCDNLKNPRSTKNLQSRQSFQIRVTTSKNPNFAPMISKPASEKALTELSRSTLRIR